MIRNALPIRRLMACARTVVVINARWHERLMAVGTADVVSTCNPQTVLFVEQREDSSRGLTGLDTAAQRPQLGLDFGQTFDAVGSHQDTPQDTCPIQPAEIRLGGNTRPDLPSDQESDGHSTSAYSSVSAFT